MPNNTLTRKTPAPPRERASKVRRVGHGSPKLAAKFHESSPSQRGGLTAYTIPKRKIRPRKPLGLGTARGKASTEKSNFKTSSK